MIWQGSYFHQCMDPETKCFSVQTHTKSGLASESRGHLCPHLTQLNVALPEWGSK